MRGDFMCPLDCFLWVVSTIQCIVYNVEKGVDLFLFDDHLQHGDYIPLVS